MALHRPLDLVSQQIRLITIQPSRFHDVNSDIIELEIEHVPLNNHSFTPEYRAWLLSRGYPVELNSHLEWYKVMDQQSPLYSKIHRYVWGDYIALSYAWSHEFNQKMIRVNGDEVYVRQNLEAALRVIRNQGYLKDGMKLWIDALSINQGDDVEKGKQVTRMGDIYWAAADVLVWLGANNPEMSKVMDFISGLANGWDDTDTTNLTERLPRVLASASPGIWQLFNDFVQLPYWKRTWVLQEISKGTAEMRVLYGDKIVKWTDLSNAALYFNTQPEDKIGNAIKAIMYRYPEHRKEANRVLKPNYHFFLRISNTEGLRQQRVEPNLIKLITFTRHKLVARPRDKVYGLLGLMAPYIAQHIVPEYGPDVTDDVVYENFAKTWIQFGENLDVLGQCSSDDSPSWVPHLHTSYRHLCGASEPPYDASKGLKPQVRFYNDNENRVLVCKGLLIGAVDSVSTSFQDPKNVNNASLPPSASKQFGTRNCSNAYLDEHGLREALWRTVVGNRNLTGGEAPDEYALLLSPQSLTNADMLAWIKPNAGFYVAGRPLISYFEAHSYETVFNRCLVALRSLFKHLESGLWKMWARVRLGTAQNMPVKRQLSIFEEAVTRVTRFAWSRRLMTTQTGYLGFAPEEARPGDVVAVLFGCSFPVLLRPKGNEYTLVKPCFVYGLMAGEAVAKYHKGAIESQEFEIA